MYVVIHDALGAPQRIRCTSVVVYSDANRPVMATREMRPDLIVSSHAKDQDFEQTLEQVSQITKLRLPG